MNLSQTGENLRYLLWRLGVDRNGWASHLAGWARCTEHRAEELLQGAELETREQERIARAADVREEELQYARLVEAENILLQNLRHLLNSLEHGQKGVLAGAVGVHYTTISKWYRGDQSPTRDHLDALRRFFGLASDTDLRTDPLFLSLTPISDLERRAWLIRRIEEADPETLEEYFPTFRRLLGDS